MIKKKPHFCRVMRNYDIFVAKNYDFTLSNSY